MALVLIAGHGRMVMGEPDITVPDRISIGWAVPAKCSSNPRVSRNMIAGLNGGLSDVANRGQKYNEHWLVPDGPENMVLKAKDLVNALAGVEGYEGTRCLPAATYWLLQPRANNAVTLSAIIKYLLVKIPGQDQIDVVWTCCRSPIGQPGLWSARVDLATETYSVQTKTSAEKIGDPLEMADFGDGSKEGFKINRFTAADGAVTLVNASDTEEMLNRATWVGFRGGKIERVVLPEGNLEKQGEVLAHYVINQKLPK
jgi:hypothetical protein